MWSWFSLSFFASFVRRQRSDVIDFSIPYFHSGVSLLAAPKVKTDIPLLAFLMPFSPELWIAIFIWLNLTAIAVAIYEWLSPFGLNPWGRQRSKNFSLSSGESWLHLKVSHLFPAINFHFIFIVCNFLSLPLTFHPLNHQHCGSCGAYCAGTWLHSRRPNRGQINSSSMCGAASAWFSSPAILPTLPLLSPGYFSKTLPAHTIHRWVVSLSWLCTRTHASGWVHSYETNKTVFVLLLPFLFVLLIYFPSLI